MTKLESLLTIVGVVLGAGAAVRNLVEGWLKDSLRSVDGFVRSRQKWSKALCCLTVCSFLLTGVGVLAALFGWPKLVAVPLAVAAWLVAMALLIMRPDSKILALDCDIEDEVPFRMQAEYVKAKLEDPDIDEATVDRLIQDLIGKRRRILERRRMRCSSPTSLPPVA
jgi:hypothetical protein